MAAFDEITVTLPDAYAAYARYWPAESPRGAVLYHHGIQSHCGWYEGSAAAIAEAGFAVLQIDRRGSGRNPIDRGHADSAEQLIADSMAARDELLRRARCDTYHLVGVSWGGKLVLAAYLVDGSRVRSVSLVTPGMFPKIGVSKAQMARIGFSMLYERKALFDIPLNDAELFTTVERWQRFFETDELTLRQATAGFYLASRRMDKPIAKLVGGRGAVSKRTGGRGSRSGSPCGGGANGDGDANTGTIADRGSARTIAPVPVHLFLAGEERIIDNEKTERFVRDLDWPDCRVTKYESARHSLEFEGDPTAYFSALVSFIDQHNK